MRELMPLGMKVLSQHEDESKLLSSYSTTDSGSLQVKGKHKRGRKLTVIIFFFFFCQLLVFNHRHYLKNEHILTLHKPASEKCLAHFPADTADCNLCEKSN